MITGPNLGWSSLLRARRLQADIPTIDYYFLGALGDLVRTSRRQDAAPIVRHGPYTFATERRAVVLRYVTAHELDWLTRRKFERLFYVLDDMLPIAAQCLELPRAYRRRLGAFTRELLPRLLALGPVLVAPNPAILALFPQHEGHLVHPCCLHAVEDFGHFDVASASAHGLRLAFFGTRSHTAGIDFLIPVLKSLLGRRSDIRCAFFLGEHTPRDLSSLPGIEIHPPLAWSAFKQQTQEQRFHVVLAPLPDTPFNRGRSITKLMDAARVGAAGLFSDRFPFNVAVGDANAGLLLPDCAAAWCAAVERLASDLDVARQAAEYIRSRARALGQPQRLKSFWLQQLDLPSC